MRPPKRPGYGTTVITELIPYELGGTVNLTYNPEGVRCRLDIPDKWIGTGRHLGPDVLAATTTTAVTGSLAVVRHRP